MKFTSAEAVEQVTWEMRLADYPRGVNRSRINDLFNGAPPYSDDEVEANNIATNVNFLESTKIAHDARRQFETAFCSPDPLMTISVDHGPSYKRGEWGNIITRELNRVLKNSPEYLELRNSTFASLVLHGIGPCMWEDRNAWCPVALGVEDVFVPSNTLLSFKNLPFFAVFRQYTGAQLQKLTSGPNVDKAWNMPLVKDCLKWVDEQARTLMSASWPEVWSPEKMGERIKADGGLYASDAVPTIDCFDFYFWNDDGRKSAWNRRIVLDAWGQPGAGGVEPNIGNRKFQHSKGKFLYNPGNRAYSDKLGQIMHFQFADASCVAPFRYHSVRSLGFLLYSVCHLQNRLRCKFTDHVFESLLQYFRVSNPADVERLQKIDLVDKGILPDGINFVKPEERWQINDTIVQQALALNRQTMTDNTASFTQDYDFAKDKPDETATRTMAKVNATAALVGSMLNRAYNYHAFQCQEILRRFCDKSSTSVDGKEFRLQCLKAGVPEGALQVERLTVKPVRVIGSGDKMLQQAMAMKLMEIRPLLDPEAQKVVDRIYIAAFTDDYSLATDLVPEQKHVSNTMFEAANAAGTLMQNLDVPMKTGINHVEYIETLLAAMAKIIKGVETTGGMATQEQIVGLNNMAKHIAGHIQILSQDKSMKEKVKEYGDDLGQFMNYVKAYTQRLAEQKKKQNGQGAGMDPKDAAKIQAMLMQSQTKSKLASESHAQRTAQRQIQFEHQIAQDQQRHALELKKTEAEIAIDLQRKRMKSFEE